MPLMGKHAGFQAGLVNASTQTGVVTAPTANTLTLPVTVDSGTPTANKVILPTHIGTQIELMFFGADTDGDEFRIQIATVNPIIDADAGSATTIYTFRPILIFDGLLSSYAGVAAGVFINTDFMVDTVTPVGSYDVIDVPRIFSAASDGPSANCPAVITIDPLASPLIEITGDIDGGSGTAATEWNVAYSYII